MPLHQPIAEPFLACTACGVFFGQLPQGQGVALDAQQVAQIAVVVAEGAGRPENYSGGGTAVDVGTALSRSCASLDLARAWPAIGPVIAANSTARRRAAMRNGSTRRPTATPRFPIIPATCPRGRCAPSSNRPASTPKPSCRRSDARVRRTSERFSPRSIVLQLRLKG